MIIGKHKKCKVITGEAYDEKEYMNAFNQPEVLKYTSLMYPLNITKTSSNYFYSKENEQRFLLYENDNIVGSLDVYDIKKNHKGTIRFWIAKNHWGKGLATYVIKLVSKYCFDNLNLKRIDAYVFKDNLGSKKVLEKCGFNNEGLLKKFDKKGNKFVDENIYALIY